MGLRSASRDEAGDRAGLRRGVPVGAGRGAELVLEMDCDFSHDPADVPSTDRGAPRMPTWCSARATRPEAGRRTGGSPAPDRVARRLPLRPGHPRTGRPRPHGGFKCFRREALEAIDLDALSAHGYAFQIETTYRVKRAGLRVREVPITFVERRAGASKMTGSIVAEAMWRVPVLRAARLAGRL